MEEIEEVKELLQALVYGAERMRQTLIAHGLYVAEDISPYCEIGKQILKKLEPIFSIAEDRMAFTSAESAAENYRKALGNHGGDGV